TALRRRDGDGRGGTGPRSEATRHERGVIEEHEVILGRVLMEWRQALRAERADRQSDIAADGHYNFMLQRRALSAWERHVAAKADPQRKAASEDHLGKAARLRVIGSAQLDAWLRFCFYARSHRNQTATALRHWAKALARRAIMCWWAHSHRKRVRLRDVEGVSVWRRRRQAAAALAAWSAAFLRSAAARDAAAEADAHCYCRRGARLALEKWFGYARRRREQRVAFLAGANVPVAALEAMATVSQRRALARWRQRMQRRQRRRAAFAHRTEFAATTALRRWREQTAEHAASCATAAAACLLCARHRLHAGIAAWLAVSVRRQAAFGTRALVIAAGRNAGTRLRRGWARWRAHIKRERRWRQRARLAQLFRA
ncbi:unnamed protein product, partial [Phaeothamnion confervicola]